MDEDDPHTSYLSQLLNEYNTTRAKEVDSHKQASDAIISRSLSQFKTTPPKPVITSTPKPKTKAQTRIIVPFESVSLKNKVPRVVRQRFVDRMCEVLVRFGINKEVDRVISQVELLVLKDATHSESYSVKAREYIVLAKSIEDYNSLIAAPVEPAKHITPKRPIRTHIEYVSHSHEENLDAADKLRRGLSGGSCSPNTEAANKIRRVLSPKALLSSRRDAIEAIADVCRVTLDPALKEGLVSQEQYDYILDNTCAKVIASMEKRSSWPPSTSAKEHVARDSSSITKLVHKYIQKKTKTNAK